MTEAILSLATLGQAFRLTLKPGHVMEPMCRLTLRPGTDLPMRLHRREVVPAEVAPVASTQACPFHHA
jgi:hypothetical protein